MTLIRGLFLNPAGLWALLAVAGFIIFYMIRPKPKKIIIPSLMFFIKDKGNSNFNSFLQKFFKDFLFFIQLAILLLLTLAIARPYINVPSITYADKMVLIIDASASMNSMEDGETRFDRAIENAIEHAKSRNTIILSTDRAHIVVENQGRAETIRALRTLKPKHTVSNNIYDSIVLAENYASGDNSAVYFISDFSTDRKESEFLRGKLYLESRGIRVFFEDVSLNKAKNIGIIDLDVKQLESTVWIKNFNNNTETFNVIYEDVTKEVTLEGNDVTSITFTTQPGLSVIEIDVNDDFKIDNKAYISMPMESSIDILMIANEDERYLTTALELMSEVSINRETPPIVNIGQPNLIILGKINKDVIIPGDIRTVKELVKEQGIPVIILAQDNILELDIADMLPVEITRREAMLTNDIIEATQPGAYITPSEIQFGQARKFYQTRAYDDTITYAHTSGNRYPAIAMSTYGSGRVLYYGLFDEQSDFKADLYYPVFWRRVLDILIGGKTISETNKKTGYMHSTSQQLNVRTPEGMQRGTAITLDYAGFYEFSDFTIAANLLSEQEQRLNRDELSIEKSTLEHHAERTIRSTAEKELTSTFIAIAFLLLLFELIYIKFRGDV